MNMAADEVVGLTFVTLYTTWLSLSLLCTHDSLNRHARVVSPSSTFGHWYFPLTAGDHTKIFGVFRTPILKETSRHCLLLLLLSIVAYAGWSSSASSFLIASLLSLLYFAQARTHGLVHNKADLVPWVLFLLGVSTTTTTAVTNIRFLMGCAYTSSGIAKLRKTGLRWVEGRNLQRMIVQFMLELRHETPNFVQRMLLQSTVVATMAQCVLLLFETTFLIVVVLDLLDSSSVSSRNTESSSSFSSLLMFAYGSFGFVFHTMTMITMNIDFLRFWMPGLFSAVLPYMLQSSSSSSSSGGNIDVLLCFCVFCLFAWSHWREYDGTSWPVRSCFFVFLYFC